VFDVKCKLFFRHFLSTFPPLNQTMNSSTFCSSYSFTYCHYLLQTRLQ